MTTIPKQLLVIGIKEINELNFKPIKNQQNFNKPFGGLWASPYYPENKFKSAWQEWCNNEMPHWLSQDAVIITLKDNIKSFIIDDQNNLIKFINIIGKEKGISNMIISPNYERAAKLYDVIYLTEKGQWETRFPSENYKFNLYGWDVETVLINNLDCIESWKYIKLKN